MPGSSLGHTVPALLRGPQGREEPVVKAMGAEQRGETSPACNREPWAILDLGTDPSSLFPKSSLVAADSAPVLRHMQPLLG